ncbi:hypothetical protein LCGC14_1555620 [marine sediment metagenome]|uniref:PARP-type domain-containing protein n=1 Tax=marine sediment metagenome TaxID=412755 RepID=A0A0F9IP12_9ZZZZ
MPERIVKNKRKGLCSRCDKDITTDYKVRWKSYKEEKRGKHYHLTCYYRMILRTIEHHKEELSQARKRKRKLERFKRYMILENLGEK